MQSCTNLCQGRRLRHTVQYMKVDFVSRLVKGSTLSKHIPSEPQTSPANKAWMLHIASELVDVSVQALYQPWLKSYHLWLAFHLHILRVFCMSAQSVLAVCMLVCPRVAHSAEVHYWCADAVGVALC